MAAAAAAYAGLPSADLVTPEATDLLPESFSGHVWIEDADGRRLTEPGRLSMRRVAPGQWSSAGGFHASVIETGIATWLVCNFQHATHRFEVGPDGLMLDSRLFAAGGVVNITAMEFSRDSS